MLQGHHVPVSCSQNQAGFSSWHCFPTLMNLRTTVLHIVQGTLSTQIPFQLLQHTGKKKPHQNLKEATVPVR